jgi:hypothetical protein
MKSQSIACLLSGRVYITSHMYSSSFRNANKISSSTSWSNDQIGLWSWKCSQ